MTIRGFFHGRVVVGDLSRGLDPGQAAADHDDATVGPLAHGSGHLPARSGGVERQGVLGGSVDGVRIGPAPRGVHEPIEGQPPLRGAADAPLVESGVIGELPVTGPAGALLRPFIRRMSSAGVSPQVRVSEPLRLDPYGVAATMVPVGGHTAGSCVVLVDGGDAVVGDLLRGGFVLGRIRSTHPLQHYFAADGDGVRCALDLVLEHGPSTLYVGHGGPGVAAEDVRRRLDSIAPSGNTALG